MKHLKRIILCFLLCLTLWLAGLAWFIGRIPSSPNRDIAPADAIVTLTGGSGRLEYGLELLTEGKSGRLFISGVSHTLSMEDILRHAAPDVRAKIDTRDIVLGREAQNTIGNAEETARWLKKSHCRSILLVTANYHMPRSIEEFAQTAPGVQIIPAPVFSENFNLSEWWEHGDSRRLMLSEYHKYLAAGLRHWLVSAIRRP